MNERIRQIWDQAAKAEPDPSREGQTKFMEKFAELIWKEAYEAGYTAGCSDTFEGGV